MRSLKSLKFSSAIAIVLVLIAVILIIRAVTIPQPEIGEPITYISTTTGSQVEVVAYQNNQAVISSYQLVVYVDETATLTSRELLSIEAEAIRKAGLPASQTKVTIKQRVELGDDYSEADIFQTFDPTNPLTYPDYNPNIAPVLPQPKPVANNFDIFVTQDMAITDLYEVSKDSEGKYTVILKAGFTEPEFRELMSKAYAESSQYTFTFIDSELAMEELVYQQELNL